MSKFISPLGKELWITQTYHAGGNNTAIDLSASTDTPVYALADGIVTYRSSGAGSYCIQTVTDSILKIYYVHTYKWVNANTFVKKGAVICYIAPTSLNGGYPTHLHLGLQAGKEIMNYFDRSIVFRTKYQDIKNIWFNGEVLDWSKFKDLSYTSFKIGDRIVFTGVQNIRKGSGTKYEITGQTTVGQIGDIIDGVRVADGYNWFDVKFAGGGTGWVADVGKFTIAPVQVPDTPNSDDCSEKVRLLTEEIEGFKIELGALENELKISDDRVKYVEGVLKTLEVENKELDSELVKALGDRDRFEREKLVAIAELNKMKEEEEKIFWNVLKKKLSVMWEGLVKFLSGEAQRK